MIVSIVFLNPCCIDPFITCHFQTQIFLVCIEKSMIDKFITPFKLHMVRMQLSGLEYLPYALEDDDWKGFFQSVTKGMG